MSERQEYQWIAIQCDQVLHLVEAAEDAEDRRFALGLYRAAENLLGEVNAALREARPALEAARALGNDIEKAA